jgi:hypothetical protein
MGKRTVGTQSPDRFRAFPWRASLFSDRTMKGASRPDLLSLPGVFFYRSKEIHAEVSGTMRLNNANTHS